MPFAIEVQISVKFNSQIMNLIIPITKFTYCLTFRIFIVFIRYLCINWR
jgi:hypothetical protein